MSALIFLAMGLVLGGAAAWLAASSRAAGIISELRGQVGGVQAALAAKEQQASTLQQEVRKESEQRAIAQTELADSRIRIEEQRKLLQEAESKLANVFDALADKALKSNNQAFLELARSTFDTIQAQAKGDLETRQKAIEGVVAPLKESLKKYEQQLQEIE